MNRTTALGRVVRGVLLTLVGLFFLFPIFWVFLMSFQTNEQILRIPPSLLFEPTLQNYVALISGRLETQAGTLEITFMNNLMNSVILSVASVALSLLLGIPAAYAFARFRFRLGEDIAFTLLSFRFAPPLLVLLPLAIYFQALGLIDTYFGLVWIYQLITLPLILWIVRGYFEDISEDIEHAHRVDGYGWFRTFWRVAIPLARPGIAAAAMLAFIFAWNNFVFALILASADKQPVTVGALAFVTASGIQYGQVAASIVLSVMPTLLLALYAQRYLVEGLSLGAVKGDAMGFLELHGVTKRFRRDTVLRNVSLDIERGETIAVVGPSGCGKTVLLRIIAGIHDPDEGEVRVDGTVLNGQPSEHRDVGMAFQNFALYPHLTAYENIASPLRAAGCKGADVRERVGEIASLLRIEHVLEHLPRALSNGQKQRTSLARSLVRSPSVLLLDDPLRNVDAKLRYEMRQELPRLLHASGATALYVTQDYKEAMALGDRVVVLRQGEVAQVDTPDGVYIRPADVHVARLFGDPTINLLEVEADGGRVSAFGTSFAAPAGHPGACLMGIRPEHVSVTLHQGEGAFPAELDAVMPLNVRAVMLLRTRDGREILASCPEEEADRFPRGHRKVWAQVRDDALMYFDPNSGARIGSALIDSTTH